MVNLDKFLSLVGPFIALIALVIAYYKLKDLRVHKRIEFTYDLYRHFFAFLNEERNGDIKRWLFGEEVADLDLVKLGDLLEQFEAVWSLKKKGMVDNDVFYDLFSYYIEKAQAAKNPTPFEYVEALKMEEMQALGYTKDLFEGFFKLHGDILVYEQTLKTNDS